MAYPLFWVRHIIISTPDSLRNSLLSLPPTLPVTPSQPDVRFPQKHMWISSFNNPIRSQQVFFINTSLVCSNKEYPIKCTCPHSSAKTPWQNPKAYHKRLSYHLMLSGGMCRIHPSRGMVKLPETYCIPLPLPDHGAFNKARG